MSLLNELNRRNVLRVGAAYIVTSWLLIQVAETIFPLFGFGDDPARLVVILLAIGFVPVLIFSWAFEWTPQGFKREGEIDREHSVTPQTGKKLDRVIMLVLALALGYFAFDKFVLDPQRDVAITESATQAGVEQAREEARLGMFNDKSIAVLPFANRSEQKEDEYFTDGMQDELLTRLSRISELKVISRTSVMRYRDTMLSIPEIARELSVAHILEGGVQRSGGQVRINVQLINAHTDEHLWAEIYDRELTAENLFAIQSEISTTIADALQATLSPEEEDRIFDLPTDSLEAYNHFLHGRQLFATRNVENMEQANREYKQAVEIDSEFALAWVGVADTVRLMHYYGAVDRATWQEAHQQAAEKAVALNDQLGEAYTSLGSYYQEIGEDEKAEAAYLKAIELNPNYAQAYFWYAISGLHGNDKRLRLLYKAIQLDPMSSIVLRNLADALLVDEQAEEGRQVIHDLLKRDPGFASGYDWLGYVDADIGLLAKAIQWHRKALELNPENGWIMHALGRLYIALGDFEAVVWIRAEMNKYLAENSEQGILLDFDTFVAQSKWLEAINYLEYLPEQTPEHLTHLWRPTFLYMLAGDYPKAYEILLKWRPQIVNSESWEQEFTVNGDFNCIYAAILTGAGEKELGGALLQRIINNIEAIPEVERAKRIGRMTMSDCYLLAGAIEKSLDLLEQEIAKDPGFLQSWYQFEKWPWRKQLEDNPRYVELMNMIEAKLAEQRALLKEMDASGTDIP